MANYKVGDIIECNVTGIEKYGIFVKVDNYYNGLIHISEISEGFIRNINDYVNSGETILAKIIEVDEEHAHIKLTIKDINYRNKKNYGKLQESPAGFEPLKDNLDKWVSEKITQYNGNKDN